MAMFKGYNKKSTSEFALRIDKREMILSCILGAATMTKFKEQDKDFARLQIREYESHKDYFDWKVRKIKKTKWLTNFKTYKKDDYYYAEWHDSRKLRIHYKWIYKGHKKTFERVLKYMHSPLFAAILILDNGAFNENKELAIDLRLNYGDSARLLSIWFKDILNIDSEVQKAESHYLCFDRINTKKLLKLVRPIIKEIPSLYSEIKEKA